MFIAAVKLAFKNMQNYTLQIYHILTTIQTDCVDCVAQSEQKTV